MADLVEGLEMIVRCWLDTAPPTVTLEAFLEAHPHFKNDEDSKWFLVDIIPNEQEKREYEANLVSSTKRPYQDMSAFEILTTGLHKLVRRWLDTAPSKITMEAFCRHYNITELDEITRTVLEPLITLEYSERQLAKQAANDK